MESALSRGRAMFRLLIASICVAWTSMAHGEEAIAVITGQSSPAINFDRANLQDIFLKRIRVDEAHAALVPLNLAPTDPLRVAFSLSLLGERPEALQRYWSERYFHGVSPPYSVRSQESMLRFVAETPGAIGYVVSCRADNRVRVVARLAIPAELGFQLHSLCEKGEKEGGSDRHE
jgi:ABC-type phosphate transport system substrate-binding protein